MNLTSGMVNNRTVEQFLECLYSCEAYIPSAQAMAAKKHQLNAVAHQEDNDSWHEAVARFNANNDVDAHY